MTDLIGIKWAWSWKTTEDGDRADCGIIAEVRPGHAYSVARCPQYYSEQQWRELAMHICDLHNATLPDR